MSLFSELRQRNVFRVAAAYIVTSWLVIQVVETIFPAFGFGDAAVRYVTIAFAVGFIPALVLSWVFEWTPEGIRREAEVDDDAPASVAAARRFDRMILAVLALALGYFAFDKFVLEPQRALDEAARQEVEVEQARQAGRTEALVESFGEKSIAVMPFTDLSPEGDQQYFADGVTEELLNVLSAFRELRVVSRASSFSLRDAGLGTREVSERLGVTYLLMGSIRMAGDRIRVSTQLVDARSDSQLWTQTYERDVDDVFAVQDQISARVARELRLNLLEPPLTSATASSRAYNQYLKGRSLLATRQEDDADQAVEFFEQAIQSDPEFAPAFSSLGVALVFGSDYYSADVLARVEAAANRALSLQSDNSEALAVMGRIRVDRGRVAEGRQFLERAVETSPSSALAWRWLGIAYSDSDPQKYYECVSRALQLDPLDTTLLNHVAIAATRIGKYEEALGRSQQLYQSGWPVMALQNAEEVHRKRGEVGKQARTIYRAYREEPDDTSGWVYVVMMMMNLGALEPAEAWSLELKERGWGGYVHPLSTVYALGGDRDRAMGVVSEVEGRIPDDWLAWIKLRIGRQYEESRQLYERVLILPGETGPIYEDESWEQFLRYAVTLRETGERERARELVARVITLLETRAATGMVSGEFQNVNYYLAQAYAEAGETDKALNALRLAFEQKAINCIPCLKLEPFFDGLREETGYRQIADQLDARFARQRADLEDEGMLLTPEQVRQLANFSFDPFRL